MQGVSPNQQFQIAECTGGVVGFMTLFINLKACKSLPASVWGFFGFSSTSVLRLTSSQPCGSVRASRDVSKKAVALEQSGPKLCGWRTPDVV